MRGECLLTLLLVCLATCEVVLDIGSSGTKVYVPCKPGNPCSDKVMGINDMQKVEADMEAPNKYHKGLAAATVFDQNSGWAMNIVSPGPATTRVTEKGKGLPTYWGKVFDLVNTVDQSDKVVGIATAGMRHPDMKKDVVGEFKQSNPTFMGHPIGNVKLTAGTEEAWYEWISLQIGKVVNTNGETVHLTGGVRGILSMGGASAQIGIPLTKEAISAFQALQKYAQGNSTSWFAPDTLPLQSAENAYKNFIGIYNKDDAEVKKYWAKLGNMKFGKKGAEKEYVAVGVISFLGLGGKYQDKHIVGGVNVMAEALEHYIKTTNCGAASGQKPSFSQCYPGFKNYLLQDQFFNAVQTAMKDNNWIGIPFGFISNTNVANSDGRKADRNDDMSFCKLKEASNQPKKGKGKGAGNDKVVRMDNQMFSECTDKLVNDFISRMCDTMDKAAYGPGKFPADCKNVVGRLAFVEVLFKNLKAKQAYCKSTQVRPKNGGTSAPRQGGAVRNANIACGKFSDSKSCQENSCEWVAASGNAAQTGTNIVIAGIADPAIGFLWVTRGGTSGPKVSGPQAKGVEELRRAEKNKQQACFGKSAINQASCEKFKQCFWNAQQNKCKPRGCGDATTKDKCDQFAKTGCTWKDPGYCTTNDSFFGGGKRLKRRKL